MEAWRHGGMEAWRHGGMEAWRHGGMEIGSSNTLGTLNLVTYPPLGFPNLWALHELCRMLGVDGMLSIGALTTDTDDLSPMLNERVPACR
jgi:hypothetical protein